MDFLAGLNPQQRQAVCHHEGPLLILAGAGSGKTRVITHRIAYLIRDHGVPPWAVLAVTFTNKAAGEMADRVASLLGGAGVAGRPTVSTFHSFCVRLLRRDGARLAELRPGFTRQFTIYDDEDQVALLKMIYRGLGLDEKFLQHRAALSRISHAKSRKETPGEMQQQARDPVTKQLGVVYEQYEGRLRQANALDFDDLLLEAVRLLAHDGTVRHYWNERLQHLMIDEYQDTNRSQYELMRLLSHGHGNVCVVGDEDQSIYSWRGADIRNILDFERDYPDAMVIRLEQNYRSTKNILEAASALVAHNKERKGKWLWTDGAAGARIGLYEALDGENEALWIADTIEKLLAADPKLRVAALYRTNFQSRQIEEALRRYRRKYIVVGGFSFYQRAEIKDTLAYAKALLSPGDTVSLTRILNVPARGIGRTTLDQLQQIMGERGIPLWDAIVAAVDEAHLPARALAALAAFRRLIEDLRAAAENKGPHEVIAAILERTGYRRMLAEDRSIDSESRIGNIEELLNAAAEASERGETLSDFLDHAALVSDADQVDEKAQVSLLTIHNAKGLEFPVVFVAGLEEGLFPHSRSLDSDSMMEEERRLCYVAMTRAEQRLYLSWARERRRFGGSPPEPAIASRFLLEVPPEFIEKLSKGGRRGGGVDLYAEQHEVRQAVNRTVWTGKTYNSKENIQQFFAQRGFPARTPEKAVSAPAEPRQAAAPAAAVKPSAPPAPARKKKPRFSPGSTVEHPRYGRGTILRREGDGEDAKLTVSFPGHGLKKLVAKYAGLSKEE